MALRLQCVLFLVVARCACERNGYISSQAPARERAHGSRDRLNAAPRRTLQKVSPVDETSRFDVVRLLGTGGMACVYEVFDRNLHRRLALKRLHETDDAQRRRRLVELFEREFSTLSQLSHPSIVQAFDYGVDDKGPYYTMELLEGGELQALAPLPYKQVCSLGRDICSAFSLLHSRRLIYRDLNPRNVHCNAQGTPKLIDFGAIAVMGPCPQLVGTPAYCAPEAVELQPLDARTDLFSLGATLYYALTGKHAFPAKTFAQLRQLWDMPPPAPSASVPNLPASLESLVMDLLKLDPAARPANAGELMEQFSAIAGQTMDEHASVMQAYLSTPSMVGRDSQLALLRAKMTRATHAQGSAVLITSASGAGRSRFLATYQLEAKMSGALVVHAAASDAADEYGVMRALGRGLVDTAPELARGAAGEGREILERIVPRLVNAPVEPAPESVAKLQRPEVLAALHAWFTAIARERTLLLAIDDFHRADEPSAACFSWLAHHCHEHTMLLLASSEAETSGMVSTRLRAYESSAVRVSLDNLTEAHTAELLRSVFGNVPHVQALAHKLYAIAAGNPRDTMRLAQTLVDRRAARYRTGAWSLPASLDAGWFPESMHQAVVRDLDALDPVARRLARVLSLADDRPLDYEECALACGDSPAKTVHEALQELLRVQFVKPERERYTIAHRALHAPLRSAIERDELLAVHRQIAAIFARRGNEPFRHAKHLLLSGDANGGVDALVAFAVTTQARTDQDPNEYVQLVLSMPCPCVLRRSHAPQTGDRRAAVPCAATRSLDCRCRLRARRISTHPRRSCARARVHRHCAQTARRRHTPDLASRCGLAAQSAVCARAFRGRRADRPEQSAGCDRRRARSFGELHPHAACDSVRATWPACARARARSRGPACVRRPWYLRRQPRSCVRDLQPRCLAHRQPRGV